MRRTKRKVETEGTGCTLCRRATKGGRVRCGDMHSPVPIKLLQLEKGEGLAFSNCENAQRCRLREQSLLSAGEMPEKYLGLAVRGSDGYRDG